MSTPPPRRASAAVASPTAPLIGLGAGAPVLAFDVGGTDIKGALFGEDGHIRCLARIPTPVAGDRTGQAVIAEIVNLAGRFAEVQPSVNPRALGLVVPGHIDTRSGTAVFAENMGWKDVAFRERVSALTGLPVHFGHDVRAAGGAEFRLGAATGLRDVVVVVIGTGIAGALFVDGRPYDGDGLAGEIGHAKVASGPTCACGGTGCLEAVASAAAIARRYSALTGAQVAGAKEVLDRSQAGDPDAKLVWKDAVDALALSFSHVVALLAPEAIVVGGGLAEAGPALLSPLTARLDEYLTFQRRPRILAARLGENAGLLGAAIGARELMVAGGTR
ncbi:ROK family protein [Sinomonas sp. JGH33]|uniref:ROK family protein n=1 Tax=Sinomonas terricola TaxID=3110330 RepID=A0ABU5TBE2_9MICC|nr:ROK family protein [Sinomonas sp. JGH33]MEA5456908.1 ROK family protein [Sinomonas sp. JGH33]